MGMTFKVAWVLLGGRRRLLKILEKTAFLLENGVPIKEAVDSQYRIARKGGDYLSSEILRRVLISLQEGKTMSEGIKDLLSSDEFTLLRNAEKTGNLVSAIENILRIEKEKREAKKVLREGIVGPVSVLVVSILLLYYIGAKVLPPIISFIGEDNISGVARFIVVLSGIVRSTLFPVAIVLFFAVMVVIFATLPILVGKVRLFLDRVPPWSIYREYTGLIFLISLSVMVASGIPVVQALKQVLPESSPYLRERVRKVLRLMSEGRSFGEALYQSGYDFPSREVAYDMLIFSRYPNMERKMFDIVEERFEMLKDDLRSAARKIGGALQTLVYLLVIGVVASVAQIMMLMQGKIGG